MAANLNWSIPANRDLLHSGRVYARLELMDNFLNVETLLPECSYIVHLVHGLHYCTLMFYLNFFYLQDSKEEIVKKI